MSTILCVEDDEDVREIIVDELETLGYGVIEAENGKVALNKILAERPDLVISDIAMPEMDGHQLLKAVRENHPSLSDLPFVFLSALADREHILQGKKVGVDDYLTKPIDIDLLRATIKARLDQIERLNSRKQDEFVKVYRSLWASGAYEKCASENTAAGRQSAANSNSPGAGQSTPFQTVTPSYQTDVSLEARVREIMERSGGKALVGQLQIIGLEDIREALGSRWDEQFEQIRSLAENVIRKNLGDSDVVELWNEVKFLIYFANLDERTAAAKARIIGREIRRSVLGNLAVDKDVAKVCTVEGDLHEVEVPSEGGVCAENVVGAIKQKISESVDLARKRERRMLEHIFNHGNIVFCPVESRQGRHPKLFVVEFDRETGKQVSDLCKTRPASEELTAQFDVLMAAKTFERICDRATARAARLIVGVGFATLESNKHRDHLEGVFADAGNAMRQQLILNLCRYPHDSPAWRIMSTLGILRRYSGKVSIEFDRPVLGNVDPMWTRTPMVISKYSDVERWTLAEAGSLDGFLRNVRQKRAHLIVRGVPTEEDAVRLLDAGVDFVAFAG